MHSSWCHFSKDNCIYFDFQMKYLRCSSSRAIKIFYLIIHAICFVIDKCRKFNCVMFCWSHHQQVFSLKGDFKLILNNKILLLLIFPSILFDLPNYLYGLYLLSCTRYSLIAGIRLCMNFSQLLYLLLIGAILLFKCFHKAVLFESNLTLNFFLPVFLQCFYLAFEMSKSFNLNHKFC
jgi:uncharacterized membrane protein YdjX (TVP38/TMEM64 family)